MMIKDNSNQISLDHGRKKDSGHNARNELDKQHYQLKIKLLDIKPVIWRRFVVPANISLDRLHEVIQIVMGWANYHLYEFTIAGQRCEGGQANGINRLDQLIKRKGETFYYLYDFGDCWEHELILENPDHSKPKQCSDVFVLKGKNACPPEDVGGVPGYFEFCKALRNPSHEMHEHFTEWVGEGYDRGDFDLESINDELTDYLNQSTESS